MIREICKDETFLAQKAAPATAADLGVAPDLVTGHASGSPRRAQRLERNVQADLVAVLEAVGHRLGHTRYLHRNAINRVLFHPFGQRITTEAHDTQRRVVHLGGSRFVRNRHPHLERRLRGEAMKLQRRQQTHQSVGMFAGHFGQGGVLRYRSIRQRVEATAQPDQLALAHQRAECHPRNAARLHVARAQ